MSSAVRALAYALVYALVCAASMSAWATSAQAQEQALLFDRAPRFVDARSAAARLPSADDRVTTATARLTVDAAPESFRIVQVDIPRDLLDASDVRYQILPGNVRLLSARTGVLHPPHGGAGLVFSVQMPATAQAGLAPLAEVVFTTRQRIVTTKIDVNVAARWRTVLSTMRAVYGARSGERVEVAFNVTNGGNATDTLELRFVAPTGWRIEGARRRIVLGVGDAQVESVRVRPPDGLRSGEAPIALIVMAGGVERARTQSTIRVASSDGTRGSRGSVLTSLTMATDRSGLVQTGLGIDASASIAPAVDISARLTGRMNSAADESGNLPQLNVFPSSNVVTLTSPRWAIQAGAVGVRTSELTGQLLVGSGGALQYQSERLLFRVMTARPWSAGAANTGRPALGFASAEVRGSDRGAYVSLARIDEYRGTARRLDALALGAWYEPSTAVRVAAEVADRSYVGGRGIGYSTMASATRTGSDLSLRFVSAPGGSAAGAQGTQSAYLHATHALTSRVRIAMDGWVASDSSNVATTRSTGWSVSPHVTISRQLSAGVDVRGIGFESGQLGAGMNNVQRQVGAHAQTTLGPMQLGVQVLRLDEDRGYSVAGFESHDVAQRVITRADGAYDAAFGSIRVMHTRTSSNDWMPAQRAVSLAVDQLHPISALRTLTLQASAERVLIGDQTLASLRAVFAVALARGTQLQVGIEQNSALRSAGGAPQRFLFMRLAKATGLSMPNSLWSQRGVVFSDLNGNGVRDRVEPGFAGLVIRCGSESVVSDVEGRFEIPQDCSGTVAVDERSLPTGWMIGRAPSGVANGHRAIAVVPTGRLEVVVTLQADAGVTRSVRLGAVAVVMTDEAGRAWIAHTAVDHRAVFDALPVGRYLVRAEASGASEPLIVTGPERVEVRSDVPRQRLLLNAAIRPVRVFQKTRQSAP